MSRGSSLDFGRADLSGLPGESPRQPPLLGGCRFPLRSGLRDPLPDRRAGPCLGPSLRLGPSSPPPKIEDLPRSRKFLPEPNLVELGLEEDRGGEDGDWIPLDPGPLPELIPSGGVGDGGDDLLPGPRVGFLGIVGRPPPGRGLYPEFLGGPGGGGMRAELGLRSMASEPGLVDPDGGLRQTPSVGLGPPEPPCTFGVPGEEEGDGVGADVGEEPGQPGVPLPPRPPSLCGDLVGPGGGVVVLGLDQVEGSDFLPLEGSDSAPWGPAGDPGVGEVDGDNASSTLLVFRTLGLEPASLPGDEHVAVPVLPLGLLG